MGGLVLCVFVFWLRTTIWPESVMMMMMMKLINADGVDSLFDF